MPRIIRWSPRKTKKAQENPTNKPNPKANQPENGGFGYLGYLNSVKLDAEMGHAELCCGVSACGAGLCFGSCGACLQLPAREESAGSWAFPRYLLTCPHLAFGGAEAGRVPPSVSGSSSQPLLPWEAPGVQGWVFRCGINTLLQQRRKGMKSPQPHVCCCYRCAGAGLCCAAF